MKLKKTKEMIRGWRSEMLESKIDPWAKSDKRVMETLRL